MGRTYNFILVNRARSVIWEKISPFCPDLGWKKRNPKKREKWMA